MSLLGLKNLNDCYFRMMFKIALVLLMVTFLGVQISNQSSIGDDRGNDDDAVAEQEWKTFKVFLILSLKIEYFLQFLFDFERPVIYRRASRVTTILQKNPSAKRCLRKNVQQ